jgi:uncharacterized membrane protein YbaN (DUF454 family)
MMRERMKRTLYMTLGFMFIVLGVLGVFLPLLPTTPFILVAAYFFSKSSDRWHQWLLANKVFGPILYNWECSRCIPYFAKVLSFSMIAVFGSFSVITIPFMWVKIVTVLLIAYACYFIANIQTCAKEKAPLRVEEQ